jgi:hypothetical protein
MFPREAMNDVPDVARRGAEFSGQFRLVRLSALPLSTNLTDLIFGQFGSAYIRQKVVFVLMAALAKRLKVAGCVVSSVSIDVMYEKVALAAAPFTYRFQVLAVMPRTVAVLPVRVSRAASKFVSARPATRTFGQEIPPRHEHGFPASLADSLNPRVNTSAIRGTKAGVRAIDSGLRWNGGEVLAALAAYTMLGHRSLSLRCHAGGCRKQRSGTSFVPQIIPQSRQNRGYA